MLSFWFLSMSLFFVFVRKVLIDARRDQGKNEKMRKYNEPRPMDDGCVVE